MFSDNMLMEHTIKCYIYFHSMRRQRKEQGGVVLFARSIEKLGLFIRST